jgi:roadblock/LC7 domain-containing protein
MRLTERFRRRDFGHLEMENTFSDPKIYAKPWTTRVTGLFTADTELIEYVCAENEKDSAHLVGKKSDDRAVKVAPEILSKYVGTYLINGKDVGITGVDIVPIQAALEQGELQIGFGTGQKQPAPALSDTTFSWLGGYVDFAKDDKDQVYMVIHQAGGDFRANRGTAPAPPVQRITVFDRTGAVLNTLGEPGLYAQPALSPDGTRVAAVKTDNGNRNIWVFDIASGKSTPVTSGAIRYTSPVWSDDGKQLAYISVVDNTYTIYRKASDGSGSAELLYTHTPGALVVLTDWSPDGRICFWSGKLIYTLNVNGDRKPVELFHTDYNVRGGRFSPDGRFIGYNSDESGKFQTFVGPLNPASKGQQISKDPAAGGIFWREDGKELLFLTLPPEQAVMAVDISTSPAFQAGPPRILFKLPSAIGFPAQLSSVASRDGQRFVFIVQTTAAPPTR